jgi:hypothetical protein
MRLALFLAIHSDAFSRCQNKGARARIEPTDNSNVLEFVAVKLVGAAPKVNVSISLTDEAMVAATARSNSPSGRNWQETPMNPRETQRDGGA